MPNTLPIYRRLIKIYPYQYRQFYETAMCQTFRDIERDQGTLKTWILVIKELPNNVAEQYLNIWSQSSLWPNAANTFVACFAAILIPVLKVLLIQAFMPVADYREAGNPWPWYVSMLITPFGETMFIPKITTYVCIGMVIGFCLKRFRPSYLLMTAIIWQTLLPAAYLAFLNHNPFLFLTDSIRQFVAMPFGHPYSPIPEIYITITWLILGYAIGNQTRRHLLHQSTRLLSTNR